MEYRREIDGLRAVAVLPVILFHAGFKAFEGGYVGVDIFFVISGYLITTIILSDMNRGKFSIVTFYERRARRILPVLFFVMFCCLPFAWLWLLPSHLKDFSQSLAAVSVFSSNIWFWKESGYFDTASELKPLLHTWSLAVEEQYYILFPLFLMALWKLRKRLIFGSLMAVGAISLMVAQWGAYNKPSATFFLLPTRGWEIAIGALIAFYFLYKKEQAEFISSHKILSEIFGTLGLVLIIYSIFAFSNATPFPSFYALIPTIGTALIITFSTSKTLVGRLLSTKAMVGVGLISYSTYLWHQPLFVFARHMSLTEPSVILLVILSILSIVLAYFSWRYVEVPFRDKKTFCRKKIFTIAFAGSVIFAIIGVVGHFNNGFAERYVVEKSVEESFQKYSLREKCDENYDDDGYGIEFCSLGSNSKDAEKVAVFGDSHSEVLLPAFDSAAKKNNYSIHHIGLNGCPPLLGVDVAKGYYDNGVCKDLALREYNYVKNNNIKKVFLVARWSLYTDGEYGKRMRGYFLVSKNSDKYTQISSRANFEKAIQETISAYSKLGVKVVVFLQVPQQDKNPKHVYYKLSKFDIKPNELHDLSVRYSKHIDLQEYNRKVINRVKEATVVNFDKLFCDEERCLMGKPEYSFYRDDDHLSVAGNEVLVGSIMKYLD